MIDSVLMFGLNMLRLFGFQIYCCFGCQCCMFFFQCICIVWIVWCVSYVCVGLIVFVQCECQVVNSVRLCLWVSVFSVVILLSVVFGGFLSIMCLLVLSVVCVCVQCICGGVYSDIVLSLGLVVSSVCRLEQLCMFVIFVWWFVYVVSVKFGLVVIVGRCWLCVILLILMMFSEIGLFIVFFFFVNCLVCLVQYKWIELVCDCE